MTPTVEGPNHEARTLTFDAGLLARGWLAASLAVGSDDTLPILTGLLIESYEDGVRLTSTDRYMVLTTWLSADGREPDDEREVEEAPLRSTVVLDPDGRAKALLSYLRKLSAKAAKDEIPAPLVNLSVGVPADDEGAPSFPGMELEQVVIDFPDHEKLALPICEGVFPAYRSILLGHEPKRTQTFSFNPELFARLGQVGKITGGFVDCTLAGPDGMVAIEVSGALLPPVIRGGVMPVKKAEIEAAA